MRLLHQNHFYKEVQSYQPQIQVLGHAQLLTPWPHSNNNCSETLALILGIHTPPLGHTSFEPESD